MLIELIEMYFKKILNKMNHSEQLIDNFQFFAILSK